RRARCAIASTYPARTRISQFAQPRLGPAKRSQPSTGSGWLCAVSSATQQGSALMPTTAKQLVDAANAVVPKVSGKEAQEMVANGAVLVDIRDSAELAQTGKAA